MKSKLIGFLLLLLLAFSSCDSREENREKLGTKPNVMRDIQGNYWIVQHNFGAAYSVMFLGDSTLFNK